MDGPPKRLFWLFAALILPLVNPPLLFGAFRLADDEVGAGWVGALLLVAANIWLLVRLARREWAEPDWRIKQLILGVAADGVMSVAIGFLEFVVFFILTFLIEGCPPSPSECVG